LTSRVPHYPLSQDEPEQQRQGRHTVSDTGNRFSSGSDEFFRWIFENAQIAIGILNIQTGEHFCNRALEEMLGYSQQELRRVEQWDEIVHPDERASGAQRYADLIQGKRDNDEWE